MNSRQKELIVIFIFLFAIIFVIMNWESTSWLFSYQEIGGLVYDFFNPYQQSNLLATNGYTVVNNMVVPINSESSVNTATTSISYYNADNTLQIPSLGVNTPVVVGQSTDDNTLEEDLDQGAVYYPGSVLPGQNGQIVILGHSAPPNWPPIKHDYIFSNIEKLNIGDEVILTFDSTQYTYKVVSKEVIAQGQDAGSIDLSKTNNVLTLVSCWPPGKNYQRIAVTTELVQS